MSSLDINFGLASPVIRPALLAKKIGMTSLFTSDAKMIPVTLLQVLPCSVLKRVRGDDKDSVLIGFGSIKEKHLKKPMKGFFDKLGVSYFADLREYKISSTFESEVGNAISADFFTQGSFVDVSGISIGKGFAGVMKRWNFRGLEASHGVSISHRSHGSTGQRQDPGKVFKGKKMAGHLGAKKITVQNLKVMQVIAEDGIIVLKGSVPGHIGSKVVVSDAKKKIT